MAEWQSADEAFERHWRGQVPEGGEHPWGHLASAIKRIAFDYWCYGRAHESLRRDDLFAAEELNRLSSAEAIRAGAARRMINNG